MEWKDVTFVLRGKLRTAVFTALDKPKTATMVSKELDTHRSTISRVLALLEKKKLVKCLDPNEPYNRYYQRTSHGDMVLTQVKKYI